MLKASNIVLRRIPQLRLLSSAPVLSYAALDNKKVRVRVVSNKKKGGKPSRGPGTHMTFKEMTTKLPLNKDCNELQLNPLTPDSIEVNKLLLYPNLKELHHLGSFNKYQYNELWKTPFSISRKSTTIPILEFLQKGTKSSSLENRMILLGELGVGKTTLISQFHSLVKSQDGIIIHFNNCATLIDGSNDYYFDEESNLYNQPMYLNTLFNKLKKGNSEQFSKLYLSQNYKLLQFNLTTRNNILDLIGVGKRLKNTQKYLVWDVLIKELKLQDKYPVYLTVDQFSEIVRTPFTNYRDTSNQYIYFDQFTLGKFIIEHISGIEKFNKGAVLVGSNGGFQKSTLKVALNLEEFDPFYKKNSFDPKLASYLSLNNGLKTLQIPRFDKAEMKILLDLMVQNGIVRDELHDAEKLLNGKYILSGNGNPRELYKACVLNYL